MAAFNWIWIEGTCPSCRQTATLRCQTHVASSYGGSSVRFMNFDYRLGETMRWWRKTDPEYPAWRHEGRIRGELAPDCAEEACYSECTRCEARLCVVLGFRDVTPVAVLGIHVESDWPSDYWK